MLIELLTDILHYAALAILLGVCVAWVVLLRGIIRSHKLTPRLNSGALCSDTPKVSVILPARNEEDYIGRCLQSLGGQDYPNYEIIAINDSSQDNTKDIILQHAKTNSRIILVDAKPKPDGWMGKNWACMEGYRRASGELLLFTDSDTSFSTDIISSAVHHLTTNNLDALTAIPRIRAQDFLTRVTLPMISVFLHTRFSALRVNDPKQKTGYFFGSFFIMPRTIYDAVGTHTAVRREIIEDGALGRMVKDMGLKLMMVSAIDRIDAVWARDGNTLWNALKRLMVPLSLQSTWLGVGILAAVSFLLFAPFPLSVYSLLYDGAPIWLLTTSSAASLMILCGAMLESRILRIGVLSALACPLGGAMIVGGFLSGLIRAGSQNSVSWRGRRYTIRNHAQAPLDI